MLCVLSLSCICLLWIHSVSDRIFGYWRSISFLAENICRQRVLRAKQEVRQYITQCQQSNPNERFISPQRQVKPHQKKQLASPCILRLHAPSLFVSHFPARPQLSASPCAGPRLKSRATNLDPEVSELSQFRLPRLMERSYTRKDTLHVLETLKRVSLM